MEDDKQLAEIGEQYASGKMLSGQVKKILTKIIQDFVKNHQEKRAKLTDDDVKRFLSAHERKFSYPIDPEVVKANSK
jgi:tryptophanyl-tRNA synthetase